MDTNSWFGISSGNRKCWTSVLVCFMQVRRLKVKKNNQWGQLRECLTISHLSLKNTHTTANTIKSNMETFEFWKDLPAHFTAEQQHSKVWTNADAICLLKKEVKLIPSHQQKMLLRNTLRVLRSFISLIKFCLE